MFARIARKVLEALASPEGTTDDRPSNCVRLACESLEDRCTPAPFTVNVAGDFPDANPGDGVAGKIELNPKGVPLVLTSLRSAIMEGNALAAMGKDSNHTIGFNTKAMGGNLISITEGKYDTLQANFAIDGGAEVTVERPADAATKHRIFDVGVGREVSIQSLDIRGGDVFDSSVGGGVRSAGDLSIEYCGIYDNKAANGGGVAAVDGKLTIRYSSIWLNEAIGYGGGVDANGKDFTIEQSDVFSNGVISIFGSGGGLSLRSKNSNVLFNTNIYGNSSSGFGGGFYAWGSLALSGGELRSNTSDGDGGGAYIEGGDSKKTWDTCKVENNESVNGRGGGFFVFTGTLDFTNPTSFTDNKAGKGFAGGAYEPGATVTSAGLPVGSQKIEVVT